MSQLAKYCIQEFFLSLVKLFVKYKLLKNFDRDSLLKIFKTCLFWLLYGTKTLRSIKSTESLKMFSHLD